MTLRQVETHAEREGKRERARERERERARGGERETERAFPGEFLHIVAFLKVLPQMKVVGVFDMSHGFLGSRFLELGRF